jgi:hypothetical protein
LGFLHFLRLLLLCLKELIFLSLFCYLIDYRRNVATHAQTWGCTHNRDIHQLVLDAGLTIEESKTHNFGTTHYIIALPNKKEEL